MNPQLLQFQYAHAVNMAAQQSRRRQERLGEQQLAEAKRAAMAAEQQREASRRAAEASRRAAKAAEEQRDAVLRDLAARKEAEEKEIQARQLMADASAFLADQPQFTKPLGRLFWAATLQSHLERAVAVGRALRATDDLMALRQLQQDAAAVLTDPGISRALKAMLSGLDRVRALLLAADHMAAQSLRQAAALRTRLEAVPLHGPGSEALFNQAYDSLRREAGGLAARYQASLLGCQQEWAALDEECFPGGDTRMQQLELLALQGAVRELQHGPPPPSLRPLAQLVMGSGSRHTELQLLHQEVKQRLTEMRQQACLRAVHHALVTLALSSGAPLRVLRGPVDEEMQHWGGSVGLAVDSPAALWADHPSIAGAFGQPALERLQGVCCEMIAREFSATEYDAWRDSMTRLAGCLGGSMARWQYMEALLQHVDGRRHTHERRRFAPALGYLFLVMAMWNHDGLSPRETASIHAFIHEWDASASPVDCQQILSESMAEYEQSAINASTEFLSRSLNELRRVAGQAETGWFLERMSLLAGVDTAAGPDQVRFLDYLRTALA